ncbi:MAG: LytTR family transcriptional regulator [Clostridiales bacterium]|nr:LytTR family transcriptional regulator [Clostridiales bacterium]
MKITVHANEKSEETEIIICCKKMTPAIENIIATLQMINQQMPVTKDGVNYLLDINQISYIEALERKTFVYTEESIYESKLKLYEMEERLCHNGFLRVSKSCLVHLKFIQSIKNDIERKLRLTMKNGEQIMVSRQYADSIKKRLGVI